MLTGFGQDSVRDPAVQRSISVARRMEPRFTGISAESSTAGGMMVAWTPPSATNKSFTDQNVARGALHATRRIPPWYSSAEIPSVNSTRFPWESVWTRSAATVQPLELPTRPVIRTD